MASKITSGQNPKVKSVLALRKKRQRDASQSFLIEGYREVLRAFENKVAIEELWVCPELFLGSNERQLIKGMQEAGVRLQEVSASIFQKIAYRDRPDGLLATARQWQSSFQDLKTLLQKPQALIVVAVSLEKPGNLGTILRSCDACAVDGVVVCDACTDVFNPNVVRASTGTLFTQAIYQTESRELQDLLNESPVQVVAATPSGNQVYTQIDYTQATALVLGCEQYGLDDQWLRFCDKKVQIPMRGCADSLNVAMACTVMCYEALRQKDL